MPSLEDYEALAPFSLDELVDAANAILSARPSLRVQARTIRFYISKGLLPAPSGAPKFARYSMDHLRRLVSIRESQDQGLRLEDVREAQGDAVPEFSGRARVAARPLADSPTVASKAVQRFQLTPNASLDITSDGDVADELQAAHAALTEILRHLRDTT